MPEREKEKRQEKSLIFLEQYLHQQPENVYHKLNGRKTT